jgi:hypothetical protein
MSEFVGLINVTEAFTLAAKKYEGLLTTVFKHIREAAENGEFKAVVSFSLEELASLSAKSPSQIEAVYTQMISILRSLGFTAAIAVDYLAHANDNDSYSLEYIHSCWPASIHKKDYDYVYSLVVRWDKIPEDFPQPTFGELRAAKTLLRG